MFAEVNKILNDLETGCNILDALPVIGTFSAALRVGAGKVQFAVGACSTFVGLVGLCSGNNQTEWKSVIRLGSEQMLHGCLNIIRGVGTLLLASVGLNFVLLAQVLRENRFAPVVSNGSVFAQPRAPAGVFF